MLVFIVFAFATFPAGIKSQLLVDNFRDNSSQPVDPDVVKVCSQITGIHTCTQRLMSS